MAACVTTGSVLSLADAVAATRPWAAGAKGCGTPSSQGHDISGSTHPACSTSHGQFVKHVKVPTLLGFGVLATMHMLGICYYTLAISTFIHS